MPTSLPAQVQRQFPIHDIIGAEVRAAGNGDKSVDEARTSAESRITELLGEL